jgi:hypothetical protein
LFSSPPQLPCIVYNFVPVFEPHTLCHWPLDKWQVIAQTKAALLDGNINVAALEAAAAASGKAATKASVARSATTLLVKNLPYSADEEELHSLFAGPGGSRSVVRLLLPPTRTLALVEFGEPQDARCAVVAFVPQLVVVVVSHCCLHCSPQQLGGNASRPSVHSVLFGVICNRAIFLFPLWHNWLECYRGRLHWWSLVNLKMQGVLLLWGIAVVCTFEPQQLGAAWNAS